MLNTVHYSGAIDHKAKLFKSAKGTMMVVLTPSTFHDLCVFMNTEFGSGEWTIQGKVRKYFDKGYTHVVRQLILPNRRFKEHHQTYIKNMTQF